jgi:predicted ATPase
MSAPGATGLAITNPLVKYRSLVQTRAIARDPSQHRLAIHLQKLYDRLKDYEPEVDYGRRLDQITRAVSDRNNASSDIATQSRRASWRSLLAGKQEKDSLALTRKLTSHENAMQLKSPKGLMLHGEVGTGKSMLIDLFADCLPNKKKRRWHFNTFMLETFAKLENLRRSQATGQQEDDYSMLWLARDLIQTSPIIFLDEFQLSDRAASKIMTNLMTSFFHLGGVLIATSNRMPEELAKAAGIEFAPPPSRLESLGWQLGLRRKSGGSDRMFGGQTEFAGFLDVLKARCEVWEMEGAKDYRRLESGSVAKVRDEETAEAWELDGHDDYQHGPGMAGWSESVAAGEKDQTEELSVLSAPMNYVVSSDESATPFSDVLGKATGYQSLEAIPWERAVMKVYGRQIAVPRTLDGTACWTFDELCKTHLGPADYISLASTYHTVILTDVPVLTWLMKNEARRFITLLDALYECRCKLIITAAAGPDDIFFPEQAGNEESDAILSETFAEAYQDVTAPFRPNILSENPNYAEPDAEPDYTHARLAGLLNADALEDDPPNKPRRNPFGRSFGRTDSEMERKPIDPDEPRYTNRPNFSKSGAFTGEDERFAYKRAQSRLWEMCGAKWWARSEADWHRPLPVDVRAWEKSNAERALAQAATTVSESRASSDVTMGEAQEDNTRDARSFKHSSASPFRTSTEEPPKISWTHIWGSGVPWGKKAGAWGKGPEGLKDRGNEKR